MPPHASAYSPSLQKMDYGRANRRKGVQMGNVLGDPFALATISIGAVRTNLGGIADGPFGLGLLWHLSIG